MDSIFSFLSGNVYHYLDFIWLPVAFFVVHKHQRLMALAFVVVCLMTFRIQVELMESTGFKSGFLSIMESGVFSRGLITYSIIIMLYLILAFYSPKTDKIIFFAATLSIYILAFCFSMVVMTL